eukprot:CAMPEP_0197180748 /NCGR_PEP_ID=MMETSP1423-20130617/5248_1 /TAXON_ID=476441 /ORGANISM="Pseudo-nitzschia heimii, Strain UNC1101" /LENGTH=527 /DNA_ID=CAMNT_0042630869 /DNA_START=72 /DNA_END=1655 /DNA_ORIENTATION=-
MAGGEGAKERRRLKRLAAQQKTSQSTDAAPKASGAAPNEKRAKESAIRGSEKREPSGDGQQRRRFQKNQRPQRRNNNNNNSNNNNAAKTRKKPKIKKPKHLKRKLEQASNGETLEKEEIRKKIEDFEAKKKMYSKHRSKPNKRRKTANAESGDATTDTNDDEAMSRLNNINSSDDSSFPRSVKNEGNKAVDGNEGTVVAEERATPKDEIRRDVPSTTNSVSDGSDDGSDSDNDGSDDGGVGNDAKDDTAKSASAESSDDDDSDADGDGDGDGDRGDSESDEESDDDSDDEPVQQRARGRRRRGRQDTAKQMENGSETKSGDAGKKGKPKIDRYCIGRKPVTDFVVGETYPATVVYAKPFGVFFDIGCHSDAFCHVSRLSDDYIESADSMFRVGEKVPSARIVEIDREKKRITVSLQSEARLEDERHSMEARDSRKEKSKAKKATNVAFGDASPGHNRFETNDPVGFSEETVTASGSKPPRPPVAAVAAKVAPSAAAAAKDPSSMTPAELKRARKLARRAERRAQAAQ